MRAMVCRAWGAPDVLQLENVPSRALRPGEVRIRVRAAGVNFADSLMVGGTYQVKPPFPFTPGLEAAGEVTETGDGVPSLRTGQRVLAVLRNGGGYAEEIVLDAATVLPIPETMDFVTAAAFPVAYGTSHLALTHRGHLQSGETLLVLGAAGGVGLTAVEIGKALGARVVAAAGGADKLAVAKSHGADELIDYRSESLRDRARELTGGKGADVVYDPVGGDAFDPALRAVNWEARMLVIGFASGRIQAVPGAPHRGAVRVLDLEPVPRRARPWRGQPLRNDASEPELAGMPEHGGADFVGVLVEHDPGRCQQPRQLRLALAERQRLKVSPSSSQSFSDFFPTTRPAPPTWRRLAGAAGSFAPIVRWRESRSASLIDPASCAAASAAVTPD